MLRRGGSGCIFVARLGRGCCLWVALLVRGVHSRRTRSARSREARRRAAAAPSLNNFRVIILVVSLRVRILRRMSTHEHTQASEIIENAKAEAEAILQEAHQRAKPATHGSPLDYMREGRRTAPKRGRVLSASELMQRATDYFEYMRDRVWQRADVIRSGALAGMRLTIPTQTPLTLSGFLIFARISRATWAAYGSSEDAETVEVVEWVEMVIETQNFEGAAIGAFNANLIARRLNLAEKQEVEHSGKVEQIVGLVVK